MLKENFPLKEVVFGAAQCRIATNSNWIEELATRQASEDWDDKLSPPVIYRVPHPEDLERTICVCPDGEHRLKASLSRNKSTYPLVDYYEGTMAEALEAAYAANPPSATDRLPLNGGDKRKKMKMVLQDENYWKQSDKSLAEKYGLSRQTVMLARKELMKEWEETDPEKALAREKARQEVQIVKKDGTTYTLPTAQSKPDTTASESDGDDSAQDAEDEDLDEEQVGDREEEASSEESTGGETSESGAIVPSTPVPPENTEADSNPASESQPPSASNRTTRTAIELQPDLAKKVKKYAKAEQLEFSEAVNFLVRKAFSLEEQVPALQATVKSLEEKLEKQLTAPAVALDSNTENGKSPTKASTKKSPETAAPTTKKASARKSSESAAPATTKAKSTSAASDKTKTKKSSTKLQPEIIDAEESPVEESPKEVSDEGKIYTYKGEVGSPDGSPSDGLMRIIRATGKASTIKYSLVVGESVQVVDIPAASKGKDICYVLPIEDKEWDDSQAVEVKKAQLLEVIKAA
ncbi:MAG: hypothetical protein WBB28_01480 [Crinalium sp.]